MYSEFSLLCFVHIMLLLDIPSFFSSLKTSTFLLRNSCNNTLSLEHVLIFTKCCGPFLCLSSLTFMVLPSHQFTFFCKSGQVGSEITHRTSSSQSLMLNRLCRANQSGPVNLYARHRGTNASPGPTSRVGPCHKFPCWPISKESN